MYEELYVKLNLSQFEKVLGIEFEDKKLIVKALVHPSYSQENKDIIHNQRLEFLGDAILSFIMNDYLYRHFPEFNEGDMTKEKAKIVSASSLSKISLKLNVDKYIILGNGELKQQGYLKENILADTYESILGAIYLDKGIFAAEMFVKDTIIKHYGELTSEESVQDYKTQFQELIQSSIGQKVEYETVEVDVHKFQSKVKVSGIVYGTGLGNSKKKAEQFAAKMAIEKNIKV